jgi:hypothetical protein
MPSSEDLVVEPSLTDALAEIAEIDKNVAVLNGEIDNLKERREVLERIAVRAMTEARLDGVKVAGRNWRIEHDHYFSVPADRRDIVMRAAKAAGIPESALIQVNTARLKTLLKEQAKDRDADPRVAYSDGTPFEGLVGEYVNPTLRHLTVG